MIRLQDIAEVTRGVTTTRLRVDGPLSSEVVDVDLLQVGDIKDLKVFSSAEKIRTHYSDIHRHLLEAGHVICTLIGAPLRAAVITDSVPDDSGLQESGRRRIAASNLATIRPKREMNVIADFIAIALQSDSVTQQVERRLAGTTVPHLTVDVLRKLEISLPSFRDQRMIVRAVKAQRLHERVLLAYLERERAVARARLEYLLEQRDTDPTSYRRHA